MLDRITQFVTRHQMLPPATRVGIAVSGGADSVFLLHALRELAPRWDLELSVIHIEHGIRGAASIEDAAFVKDLADKLGLPFHLHSANVPAIPDNQEQAARRVRHAFFAELIATGRSGSHRHRPHPQRSSRDRALSNPARLRPGRIGGHPPSDQGRPGAPAARNRPAEIEAWLRERNIAWREDASNQNRIYARNRLRHEILPLLRETFNPNLDETLSNMATVARDEELYWESTLPRPQPPVPEPPDPGIVAS